MDKLNKKQRSVVWIVIVLAIAMFLYTPVVHGSGSARGLDWLWDVRVYYRVNYGQLLIQYALLGVVTWAGVTSLKTKGD